MRKLHSLISLLLVLLMLAPCALADAPLLQAASDWNLADTPLSVTLSISLQAHAPFDETRTAMLDRVLAPLSLNLYASDGESGVSVLMNGNELLTMAQKGDAVQFSCMPNVSYASLDGNALELLLGTTSDSLDLRAVDGTFEKWIDDGWVLSNAILEPFAEYGKRKSVKTTIKDMGLARSCTDYTFSKSKLEEMQQTLLSLCPEGDLHDLIASLTFSGTQKLRVYRTEDEVPLRVEYNGVCGVDGKLRTVKLVWRTKRESGETRDEITLTSPAKSGTDKNTLDFERIMTFSSGKITMQGTCSYKVTASKQTTQTEVTFDLTNRLENDSDNVSGSVAIYTKFGTSHSGLNAERPYNWTGDMVADMLQNMVYLGHTVNLRYSTKSYKDKKRCERPKSEWLIFENTHEELVDQETWDIVQEVRSHKRRRTNMDEQNMFSGLVYCADCGKPMVLHRAHTMKPEQNHFTCRTYKKDGAEVCSAHYIREVALKEIVLETIRRATEFARSDPERFAAYIQQKQSTEVAKEIRGVERELSTMRKRDGELDVVFKRMYEDSALGRVSNEQFRLLSEAYSKEKAQLAEAIPATEERLEKLRSSMANAKNFIAKARKFTDMTELTPELLRTFVAKIIVYEKEVKYSKHAPQKIHICFRDFNLNETDDMLLCGETTEKADSTIALPA